MNPPTSQSYDYTQSGIDSFLNRSIDQVTWQTTLDTTIVQPGSGTLTSLPPQANSNNQRFDSTQVTGQLGDTLQVGGVSITNSGITASDGNNTFFVVGQ